MATLNQTQRKFIVIKLVHAASEHLHETTASIRAKINTFTKVNINSYYATSYKPEQHDWQTKDNWMSTKLELNFPQDMFNEKTCNSLNDLSEQAGEDVHDMPREWYLEQMTAGKHEFSVEFENCMDKPRPLIVFPEKEKALQALRKKTAKAFPKEYTKHAEYLSELRYMLMETNKFIKTAIEQIMLCDNKDAATLNTNLLAEVKQIK